MSIINKYNNPVVHNWNLDDLGEPTSLVRENESKPVLGGKIALEEIPDSYRRVFIDGYMEIDLKQKIIDEFHYKVDYTNGIVFFHSSKEGQTINITRYYGRGMFYIPSSRVWSKIDDLGNVVSTLADMEGDLGEMVSQIDAINTMAENASGIATSLETNVATGTTLNTNLQTSITTATTKKTQLDGSISTSTTSKSSLDTSIASANTSKSSLDTSIGNATTSKSNLDSSISSGNTLKTNLDGSIATGTTLKNDLNTNITTGNQLKVDLPPIISSASTAKTNLEGSITTSTTKKSDLDGSIVIATTKKTDLDSSISSANTINNTLSHATTGTIKKATDINATLNTSIGTANTSKTNLDTSAGIANTSKSNLDGSIIIANTTKTGLDGSITTGNSLKGELDAIISGTDYEQVIIDVNSLKQDRHIHDNKESVLDNLSDISGKLKYNGQDVGIGDMEKRIYDANDNGKVDVAENAEKLGGQLPDYYAKTTDIPTKTSQLANDSNFETTTGSQNKANQAEQNAKGYTDIKVADLVGQAPETLDTLHELADALGHDPNFATTISSQIGKKAEKIYVDTELGNKVDNSRVLTDVPVNANFENTITTINGKTGAISKADIVALGIPESDTNTTYTEITTAEIDAGTTSTLRAITARRVKYILDKVSTMISTAISTLTKSDVGLSNVDNIKQMPISDGVLENYREKLVALSGTTPAINLSLGNVFTHTLSGNTTYSISNAVNGQAHSFTLIITQTATVRTITFPASVKWQGGEIPDLSGASKTYVLTFVSLNGGSIWLGMFGGEF